MIQVQKKRNKPENYFINSNNMDCSSEDEMCKIEIGGIKKLMSHRDPARFTPHIPLDLTEINNKIEEVHILLDKLYQMKEFFEKKQDAPVECNYFC